MASLFKTVTNRGSYEIDTAKNKYELYKGLKEDPNKIQSKLSEKGVSEYLINPLDTGKYLAKQGMTEAKYQWNKLSDNQKTAAKVGAGALALAGAGTLAYKLFKKNKKNKSKYE